LEDCFEGIICFETLNQPFSPTENNKETQQIFDIVEYFSQHEPSVALPKTPVLCKPSVEAMEYALKIANVNPQRAVSMH
jgi:putative hydrolase of the HAD superfamily